MEMLFFDLNRKWTEIDSEDQYLEYKKQIREKKTPIRFEKELKKIPKDKHEKIRLHFENVYNQYQKYIFENYPTISNEFSLYNSVVRIYIIDRKGQPGESTMQLNVYKSTDGRTSITVASQFYDFISRFSNLEEIEHTPVVCSLSLFQIDNPAKYNFQFDIPSIHRELSQIFIRNSNEQNLKDFLLFLLRTELKSVYQIEGYNNELQINRNQYCKLFLSNVPNLNAIRKELQVREDGQKYSFAIFTSRPDEETLSLLKSHEIEPIFIDRLAREHINNQNGEIIDWYVKSKLDRFEIKKSNDKENLSETLIQRLENCPTGLKGWMDYENICTEIFNYGNVLDTGKNEKSDIKFLISIAESYRENAKEEDKEIITARCIIWLLAKCEKIGLCSEEFEFMTGMAIGHNNVSMEEIYQGVKQRAIRLLSE